MLESLESARARGAAVFAEILGFGASLDGGALTAPDESARFAEQAVRGALADAGLEPMPSIGFPHTVRGPPQ